MNYIACSTFTEYNLVKLSNFILDFYNLTIGGIETDRICASDKR